MMKPLFLLSLALLALSGCDNVGPTGSADISVLAKHFTSPNTTFTVNDETIVITSTCQPDHVSAYYPTSSSLYEAYTGFAKNPNEIEAQSYTMTVSRYPAEADNHKSTPYGAMGIAVNSVAIFNQYAAPGDDLEQEKKTFDQWSGHPQNSGIYHYHLEPTWLTKTNGNESLIGILMDGFPVYGPYEDGVQITNSDLDEYHGHFGPTADFPDGIYHYHITAEDPYINGDGFYGTKGTISN